MRLVIIGAAGAGKGTLAERIKKTYQIAHISTGDMFRAEIAQASELGLKAKAFIDSGHLVPDELTISMVAKRLQKDDCIKGFLLDGFPRTLNQAKALDETLKQSNQSLQLAINLSINVDCLAKRIIGRMICPNCKGIYHTEYSPPKIENVCDECSSALMHRSDDTHEQLKVRLAEFYQSTGPVLAYYREHELVVDLDATQLPKQVWEEVLPFLETIE